jgi:uncharacterized RDD family membrane protein YckC
LDEGPVVHDVSVSPHDTFDCPTTDRPKRNAAMNPRDDISANCAAITAAEPAAASATIPAHAVAATALQPSGLLRRLAAMVYDGLLVLAVLMIITACFLPFTRGEAVTWDRFPWLAVPYWAALVGAIIVYFGVPWTRGGQTLGMASWRLRVQRNDGYLLTWRDVVVRLGASVLSWLSAGLGWAWALYDRERRTWHDQLSRSRVVVLPKARRVRE